MSLVAHFAKYLAQRYMMYVIICKQMLMTPSTCVHSVEIRKFEEALILFLCGEINGENRVYGAVSLGHLDTEIVPLRVKYYRQSYSTGRVNVTYSK